MRSFARWPSAAPHAEGQQEPPGQEAQSAERRHGAEPAHAGEGQQIQTSRKEDGTGEERPSRRAQQRRAPPADRPGDGDEASNLVN